MIGSVTFQNGKATATLNDNLTWSIKGIGQDRIKVYMDILNYLLKDNQWPYSGIPANNYLIKAGKLLNGKINIPKPKDVPNMIY